MAAERRIFFFCRRPADRRAFRSSKRFLRFHK
jgi:hypothetical protein